MRSSSARDRRALLVAPLRMEGGGHTVRYALRTPLHRCGRPPPTCRASASMNTETTIPASARRANRLCLSFVFLRRDVQTALGGDLVPAFGHQHRHLGLDAARDCRPFRRWRPILEVQPDMGQARAGRLTSSSWDVAPILAQVHGDAVGAAEVRLDRLPRPGRARRCGAPGAPWGTWSTLKPSSITGRSAPSAPCAYAAPARGGRWADEHAQQRAPPRPASRARA